MPFRRLLQNRFYNNMSWMIISSIAQMLISIVINAITARYLGPANYGIINYVASFVTMFTPICQVGLYSIVVREVVTDKEHQGEIIGSALAIRVVLGLASAVAIVFLVSLLKAGDKLYMLVGVLSSARLIFEASDIIKYWYQSQLQYKKVAIVSLIAYVIMSAYRVALLITNRNIVWFSFAFTLDIIVVALGLALIYITDSSPRIRISLKKIRDILTQSKNLFLSSMIAGAGAQVNSILLGQLMPEAVVGYYACALACCGIAAFIPGAVIDSARPLIMEAKMISKEEYVRKVSVTSSGILYLSLIFAVATIIGAKYLILLLYGAQYLPAVTALRVCACGFYFSYIGSIRTIWLVSEKKLVHERNYSFLSSVLAIALAAILIPPLGLYGGAIAYSVKQVISFVILTPLFKETREFHDILVRSAFLKDIDWKRFAAFMKGRS